MLVQAVLTVAESKRLIAKGVAAHPIVRRALAEGTVVIARGSTNGYVAEEILGERFDKAAFLTGHTLPRGYRRSRPDVEGMSEIVLRRGEVVKGVSLADALAGFQAGDVFIKGANALSCDRRIAGILIGSPTAGTIGAALPVVQERGAHLVTPVGLEKLVSSDLAAMSALVEAADGYGGVRRFWAIDCATIISEIETVELLTGATCLHLSAGGIGGAEGSVRLLATGDDDAVNQARQLLDAVAGEPPFEV